MHMIRNHSCSHSSSTAIKSGWVATSAIAPGITVDLIPARIRLDGAKHYCKSKTKHGRIGPLNPPVTSTDHKSMIYGRI